MTANAHCLNCGKSIPKRGGAVWFLPATANGRENHTRQGHDIYLDPEFRPETKDEAQKFVNYPVTKVGRSGAKISVIFFDDGSRIDPYFHTKKCAAEFGAAAARAGFRKA